MKILFNAIFLILLFLVGCSSDDPAPPPDVTLTHVYLDPVVLELDINTSEEFSATAVYSDGTSKDVTEKASWSLKADNTTLKLNATRPWRVEAVTAGTDNVIASYDEVQSEGTPVTVVDEVLMSLVVSPKSVGIGTGNTLAFKAEGIYANRTQDLTLDSIWTSNDVAKVTMNKNIATGVVVTSQAAIISAGFEGLSDTAQVHVYGVIDRMEIVPADVLLLFNGYIQQFRALAYYVGSNEPSEDITNKVVWQSSDDNILIHQGNGKYQAIDVGLANITAKYTAKNLTATHTVSIAAFFIMKIDIRPKDSSITVNATKKFDVYAINSDTSEYKINNNISLEMSVSNPDLAYFTRGINNKIWTLHAVATGTVTVRAQFFDAGKEFLTETTLTIN